MNKVMSETLPPCRVCGAPATGLHYGVISCEGCKAFYRRSLARGDIYECPEDRECNISSESRNACAYCRYQKCIKMGMSKDAIKTGRYSYQMKASNIREAKGLQSGSAKNSKPNSENLLDTSSGSLKSSECSVTSDSGSPAKLNNTTTTNRVSDTEISSESDMMERRSTVGESKFRNLISSEHGMDCDAIESTVASSELISSCLVDENMPDLHYFSEQGSEWSISNHNTKSMSNVDEHVKLNYSDTSLSCYTKKNRSCTISTLETGLENDSRLGSSEYYEQLTNDSCMNSAVPSCDESEQKLYDVSKIEIYDRVIQQMYDKHKVYVADSPDIGESLSTTEHEYLETIELKRQIFGSLEPMPIGEYMNFYKETGLDIDGRREMLLELLPIMEFGVRCHVEFSKTIPGFCELCVNDQIGLIKGSGVDFFMIGSQRLFNSEHRLYSPCAGKVYHLDDMRKLETEVPESEPMFVMQQKIKKLNLTEDETVVLIALCIMATDNCELEDPTRVEYSQDFLLECLFYLFDKHHPNEIRRFTRIVECMTELRVTREVSQKSDIYFFNIWRNSIEFPPLLRELCIP